MNRYFLSILLIVATFSIYASDLEQDINSWLNAEMSNNEFIIQLENRENSLDVEQDSQMFYMKSILNLYKGEAYYFLDDKKSSIQFLEVSILNAEKAIKLEERSDYYRVLSESGSYLMLQKGIRYIIKNSKEVQSYSEKALELDSTNIKAEMIIANGLINAPKIFGGDLNKGVEILERLTNVSTITKEEKFNAFLALARVTKSESYALKALAIYPNNKRAKDLLNSLKG